MRIANKKEEALRILNEIRGIIQFDDSHTRKDDLLNHIDNLSDLIQGMEE